MANIVIELSVDFAGKTFAEVEAGVMAELRRRVGPALQTELRGARRSDDDILSPCDRAISSS